MSNIFETFGAYYSKQINEMAIPVSKFNLQKYLNVIKKDIKAKDYDINPIDDDLVGVTYNTGLTLLIKLEGDYGSIIGYNTDGGSDYNYLPKNFTSYKDIKKSIKLLNVFNTKKTKSATELKVVVNNKKDSIPTVDVGIEDALSNYGIDKLYGCDLDELKKNHKWLLKAEMKNAKIELNKYDLIDMYEGTWVDGEWYGMYIGGKVVWENGTHIGKNGPSFHGTWKDGTWVDGSFDGTWEKGTWEKGNFYSGTWKNGTWKNGEFGSINSNDTPSFEGGTWENGIFNKGIFKGGTWKNGTFNGDTFSDGATWIDGEWNSRLTHPNEEVGTYEKADVKKTTNLLKKYLKEKFGYVFKIRTKSFAGGTSMDINYLLGVDEKVINGIVDDLEYGRFDSMTDYAYSVDVPKMIIDGYELVTFKYVSVNQSVNTELSYKFAKMMSDSGYFSKYFKPLESIDDLDSYGLNISSFGSANTWGQLVGQSLHKDCNFPTNDYKQIEPVRFDLENNNYIFTYNYKGKEYKTSDTMPVFKTKSKMIKTN